MDESRFSISAPELYARLGTAAAPLIVDVRRAPAFESDGAMIAGAIRRPPDQVEAWRRAVPAQRAVVVYCVHGHEVSQSAASALRAAGVDARYLADGIAGWREHTLPTAKRLGTVPGKWVTRERPKVDRIACPWLVRRFIDPEAEFLYVPTEQVFEVATAHGATAYDIPGSEPFSHDGPLCSFDGFLKVFELADLALDRLAVIVRGADTGCPELAPQSSGLVALSLGLSANFPDDDHAMLAHGMVMYDALYAWCRSLQSETHSWKPAA
ncbi:MAG: chromate resistance protein [Proteobacteria bacterium]|nr:chromate resistance protein [Pseudomonadota bacterium]